MGCDSVSMLLAWFHPLSRKEVLDMLAQVVLSRVRHVVWTHD